MNAFLKKGIPATLVLLAVYLTSPAQKEGNIVEYFGREVVEEINEGAVIHVFKEGLLLPAVSGGRGLMPDTDIIAWHYANGTWNTPEEGQLLHPIHAGNDSVFTWQAVEANEENSFRGRKLRNSFLYTQFQSPREDVLLLDARGHTQGYMNGKPIAGDHYDFGYTLIPFKLKKGLNEFIYTPGTVWAGYLTAGCPGKTRYADHPRHDRSFPHQRRNGGTMGRSQGHQYP
jgi:hypothetical protein